MKYFILFTSIVSFATVQSQKYTTPIPILKQINKHNEDGSYSYGYEGADGAFKIETKYPNGEVFGKYGYVDDTGKSREIEYGASRRGFEPQGNDINVPPPTIHDNQNVRPLGPNEEDDGQYREDPSIYYKDDKYNHQSQQQSKNTFGPKYTQPNYQQQYQPQTYQQPSQQQTYQQPTSKFNFDDFLANRPQAQAQPQQQAYYKPQPQQEAYYNPQPQQQAHYNPQPAYYNPQPAYNHYRGAPATNVDLNQGSYTVNYRRR